MKYVPELGILIFICKQIFAERNLQIFAKLLDMTFYSITLKSLFVWIPVQSCHINRIGELSTSMTYKLPFSTVYLPSHWLLICNLPQIVLADVTRRKYTANVTLALVYEHLLAFSDRICKQPNFDAI